jgi:hypothetical protein
LRTPSEQAFRRLIGVRVNGPAITDLEVRLTMQLEIKTQGVEFVVSGTATEER